MEMCPSLGQIFLEVGCCVASFSAIVPTYSFKKAAHLFLRQRPIFSWNLLNLSDVATCVQSYPGLTASVIWHKWNTHWRGSPMPSFFYDLSHYSRDPAARSNISTSYLQCCRFRLFKWTRGGFHSPLSIFRSITDAFCIWKFFSEV